ELKWDGIRVLAAVDKGGWRLWGRERADYTARYPELDVLRRLPAGTRPPPRLFLPKAQGGVARPRREAARPRLPLADGRGLPRENEEGGLAGVLGVGGTA